MSNKLNRHGMDQLAPIDAQFQCVMMPSVTARPMQAQLQSGTLIGTLVKIPSDELFICNSGKVFIVTRKQNGKPKFNSLEALVKAVPNTVIIENFTNP